MHHKKGERSHVEFHIRRQAAFIAAPPRKTAGWHKRSCAALLGATMLMSLSGPASTPATAQPAQKPNILFIMGDDIGWMQPSIYHRGLMVGETPNIDRIGNEGAIFMDYYAKQSCTSGRNAFFTGMYPLRTGMILRNCPAARPICGPAPRRSPNSCSISATTPASSARTISATTPTRCRPRTASRNTGATCITSTRCRA